MGVSHELRTKYFEAWRELRKRMEKCSRFDYNGQARKIGLYWTYQELAEEMILWLLKTIGQKKYKKQVPWIKVLHMLPQRFMQRMEVDFPLRQVYTDDFVVDDKKIKTKKYRHYSAYNSIVECLLDSPPFGYFLEESQDAGITNPAVLVPPQFDADKRHPKPALKNRDSFPAHAAASASAEADLHEQVDDLTHQLRPLLVELLRGRASIIESIVDVLKATLPTDPRPLSRASSEESVPSGAIPVVKSKC